ncbi:hypothetical protein AKJ57_04710 [candidate division MSBL1 archaeon SCGC-AAA259A05]|uniref:Protease PrsW n=1 Tax=candidate division MSBL1 archaeon SCGC-AAA259A05 TaxID=1698259 RepID=A0A133U6U7_9EURY|nr:hypothetical protein AKJ57_04710 [candidate division MSBL1 archaeon SCGC-AAA259A05]
MNDDSEGKPAKYHLLICSGLGALAGLVAGYSNMLYGGLISPIHSTSPDVYIFILASIVAPISEESIKPLGLYLLKEEEGVSLNLENWILLGLLAGFGFWLLENGLYTIGVAAKYGSTAGLTLLGIRSLFPVHMFTTSIVGFGIGLWEKSRNIIKFLKFLVLAIVIHGSFNLVMIMVS